MTNLKTIYDQYKENWDLLASIGNPNVAEAAKHFLTFADMERALGYSASTVKKWAEGQNNVSSRSEGMAAHWLSAQIKNAEPKNEPADKGDTQLLLVITPLGSADKVRRVLAMMGCEFEEV
jgi:N12 class adenine-specific DNA methylase